MKRQAAMNMAWVYLLAAIFSFQVASTFKAEGQEPEDNVAQAASVNATVQRAFEILKSLIAKNDNFELIEAGQELVRYRVLNNEYSFITFNDGERTYMSFIYRVSGIPFDGATIQQKVDEFNREFVNEAIAQQVGEKEVRITFPFEVNTEIREKLDEELIREYAFGFHNNVIEFYKMFD